MRAVGLMVEHIPGAALQVLYAPGRVGLAGRHLYVPSLADRRISHSEMKQLDRNAHKK